MSEAPEAVGAGAPWAPGELQAIAEAITSEFEAATPPPPAALDVAVLDPCRLRVRWSTPPERRAAAQANLGAGAPNAPLVLRFHRCGNGHPVPPYDVFLEAESGERSFAFRRGGVTYRVQLGLLRPDGAIEPLAESGSVRTPPGAPSLREDLTILDLQRWWLAAGAAAAAAHKTGETADLFTEDATPSSPADPTAPAPSSAALHPIARVEGAAAAPTGVTIAWP